MEGLPPISHGQGHRAEPDGDPGQRRRGPRHGRLGHDWVNGFRELLGLPALSGSALTAASTLNGSMVGS